ncbi:hypothetical protein KDX23_25805 [Burkholderia vietnamiensis]|uniref:hypothetical protein n=1 Tax=Burkholderia vietnamiensis TaxID=60552 RepID=UPI001B931A28|nr:hypothetical protein [Burkholderia vietnamiensis]MBR8086154.1 hypothetical protein [Burkholderia vietnamiensis]
MQSTMNRTSRVSQTPAQYDLQADIEELRKLLSVRHEDPRKQRFRNLYDTIQALIAAGVSHAAIIRKLKSMDLNISPVTFKNWFTEIQRARDGAAAGDQPGAEVSQVRDAMRRGTACIAD